MFSQLKFHVTKMRRIALVCKQIARNLTFRQKKSLFSIPFQVFSKEIDEYMEENSKKEAEISITTFNHRNQFYSF